MQKVVDITQCASGWQQGKRPAAQEDSRPQSGDGLGATECTERRGIVLEFPRTYRGPLFAASVALLTIAGAVASAVRV
jgi:hypothetical protein